MGLILWIIFGGIIGWVASVLMKTNTQQGIILNIIVGMVGAVIGGLVLIGPTCAVVKLGEECADKPYATTLILKSQTGDFNRTVKSGADGRFVIELPLGTYIISKAESVSILPSLAPVTVMVSANQMTQVTLNFDSGIR